MSNELINFEYKGVPDPDFKLRYISISKYEGDWQSHPHTHQFSELFYVISGKGVFYIENDTVSVCADDLIIINPHIEHTEKTMSNDPMTYIVFGVEGLAFYFNSQNAANPKGYSYYNYGSAKTHFINFSQIMIKEFNARKPGFEAICHGLLQVLLVYITREQHLSVISDTTLQISKECFVAKKYIDANYAKNITFFYGVCWNIPHQLPDGNQTRCKQRTIAQLQSLDCRSCIQHRFFITVVFFADFPKEYRYVTPAIP